MVLPLVPGVVLGVVVLGEVVLLPEPLEPLAPLLLGEVVLPVVLLPLVPVLAVSPAMYSLSESLPSPSLSRALNLALPELDEAPALEEDLSAEEELLGELELPELEDDLSAEDELPVDALPDEPLLIDPLDWLVLGELAELPLEALSPAACTAKGTAKTAATAAAIRVLRFIRSLLRVNVARRVNFLKRSRGNSFGMRSCPR